MAYRVLIVEDDPMVAMINEQYVKQNKNFTVSTICRNGEEALNFLEGNKIDLIVLDVYMPVMDGVETLKRIRDKKISSEVIMVTAANDTNTLEQTMHLGVLDYLIKPFTLERFLVALEKFLSQKETLKQNSIIDQNCIDRLMTQIGTQDKKIKPTEYPKGINKKTLSSMIEYFNENPGWHSVDMIAEKLKISIVTVRHYMNYLVQQKSIVEDINYETGGRPCMLYKKSYCQE
ncbi:response regulator [Treponema sp.]|uniref:response regulator n=1 Tax=Treponema sp. TaxID=166 RepID=UPI002A7FF2CA|nr:response regulator [Treponema sp.]MCI6441386.1 response regulator [Spirochaetia bacterium]MDY4132565.1 response regulator [Treponema sp.]